MEIHYRHYSLPKYAPETRNQKILSSFENKFLMVLKTLKNYFQKCLTLYKIIRCDIILNK